MKLIIEDDEGRKTVVPFVREEISIGRKEGNTIRLTERNVSRRHARLLRQNVHVFLEDLGSYNGVKVNGGRVQGRAEVHEGDLIEIGDYNLAIQAEAGEVLVAPHMGEVTAPRAGPPPLPGGAPVAAAPGAAPVPRPGNGAPVPARVTPEPRPAARDNQDDLPDRRESTAVIRVDLDLLNRGDGARPLSPEARPQLMVVTTELAGQVYDCQQSVVSVGRNDDNDMVVAHRSISSNHCRVFLDRDGAWKVVDLGSANGLKVNGEEYGLIDLRRGDLIELGHVKLRFCEPGEQFVLTPEAAAAYAASDPTGETSGTKSSSKGLVLVVLAFVVLGGAGGAFLVFKDKLLGPSTKGGPATPTEVAETGEPTVGEPVEAAVADPEQIAEALKSGLAAETQQQWEEALRQYEAVLALDPANAEGKAGLERAKLDSAGHLAMEDAEVAMTQERWADAWRRLLQVQEGSSFHADAQQKLTTVRARYAAMLLTEAQTAMREKDLDFADEVLNTLDKIDPENVKGTRLREQIVKARKIEARPVAVAKTTRSTPANPRTVEPKAAPATPVNANKELAKEQMDTGAKLIMKGRYVQAITFLNKAVSLDPENATAHRLLGIAHANSGDMDKAAFHYRRYISMNPNAKDRPQVERILEQYERSRSGK